MRKKSIKRITLQFLVLVSFVTLAAGSGGTEKATVDLRGAAVGGTAGYYGYTYIGTASSESQAIDLATRKGYSGGYVWDSNNGAVYAK